MAKSDNTLLFVGLGAAALYFIYKSKQPAVVSPGVAVVPPVTAQSLPAASNSSLLTSATSSITDLVNKLMAPKTTQTVVLSDSETTDLVLPDTGDSSNYSNVAGQQRTRAKVGYYKESIY